MTRILLKLINIHSPAYRGGGHLGSTIPDPPLGVITPNRWGLQLEWKPADLWVGVYLHKNEIRLGVRQFNNSIQHYHADQYHVYVCLLPMLPLHIIYNRRLP